MNTATSGATYEALHGTPHCWPWGWSEGEGMRVLITADAIGGVWNHTLELSGWLVAHGFDVLVATMGPRPSAAQVTEIQEKGVRLATSEYRLEWMDEPWDDVDRAGEWLLQLEHEFHPQVVHLNGYAHVHLPFAARVVLAVHSSIGTWWRAVHGSDAPRRYRRYVATLRSSLATADHVVAPSRAMMNALLSCELRDRYVGDTLRTQQLWSKTTIVPNGTPAPASREYSKERFALSAGRLWDRAKNLALLDRIAHKLSWPIRIAGPLAFEVAQSKASTQHLEHLGNLAPEVLHETMNRASIYLAPALYEPFGLATLEAAHRGCALILADIESYREIWGDAAEFVNPRDPDEWASAIQKLIMDDTKRMKLGQDAATMARSLTTERMGSAYSQIYATVLAEGREETRHTEFHA